MGSTLWRLYKENNMIKVDLSEIGLDGYWIKVLPFTSQPISVSRSLEELPEDQQQRKMMTMIVYDWNLENESGDRLPLPSESDEWESIIPADIMILIMKKAQEADKSRVEIPLENDRR